MGFFEKYSQITGKDLPDPKHLEVDDKCVLAYQLDLVGESKTAIAKYLGVSRPTVYAYIQKATDEKIQELENQTYLQKFMERIHGLEAQREYHRKIMERIRESGDSCELDPVTGEMIAKTTHLKNLTELGRLIRDYDKLIIDLEMAVGIIPKNDTRQLFSSLKDADPDADSHEKDLVEMNSEEVTAILLQKLRQRTPTLGGNALKDIKDEKVI